MENTKNIAAEIRSAVFEYELNLNRKTEVAQSKDRVKNLMFHHRNTIVFALERFETYDEEMRVLNEALKAADAENDELRAKIKQLEGAPARKKKTMTAVVE